MVKTAYKAPRVVSHLSYFLHPQRRRVRKLLESLEMDSLTGQQASDMLAQAIRDNRGFFHGRPGGTESEGLRHFVTSRLNVTTTGSLPDYPAFFTRHALSESGIVYSSLTELDSIMEMYLKAALSADLFGFGKFAPGSLGLAAHRVRVGKPIVRHDVIEPWEFLDRPNRHWLAALAGRFVLVVHPFETTIQAQYLRRSEITAIANVLPQFRLRTLRPPISLSTSDGASWDEAFEDLCERVLAVDFDVALIGAGSYGLPLAHFVARQGKVAVHTAGATQVYFGIMGKRWESKPPVAQLADATWVRARPIDLDPAIGLIDRGSYL